MEYYPGMVNGKNKILLNLVIYGAPINQFREMVGL
jgi:hypothetical protein